VAKALKDRGNHIIVSRTEHHSVIRPAEELQTMGFAVTWLDVDRFGRIDPDDVKKAITSKTILVAVMHASNEIGTVQPVKDIGRITRERKVCFLTDAVQTAGHIPVNVQEINCDLLSLAGHKFYGPKGVGALYIHMGTRFSSCLLGGDQERSRRASTHHVPGIVGMGKAIELCLKQMPQEIKTQTLLRDQLIDLVRTNISGVILNGHPDERLPNNAHFSFEGVDGESLLMSLDMNGFCTSMGSACTSGSLTPSHVLTAIGLSDPLALGSLRVTVGRWTTNEEIGAFCEQLKKSVELLRK
jgi:cysteine desulfurase